MHCQARDAYGGYFHLATPKRPGGYPLHLAFCWAHGRRKLIKAKPQKGSPIVDEALLRIAALYTVEDAIRSSDRERRRAARPDLPRPLVDAFFAWLKAQTAWVSRKSDLGKAMAYMLKRQDGFRLLREDGRVAIDSNMVENAIRSPAMNHRNALFAPSRDFGHAKTLPGNGPPRRRPELGPLRQPHRYMQDERRRAICTSA